MRMVLAEDGILRVTHPPRAFALIARLVGGAVLRARTFASFAGNVARITDLLGAALRRVEET